MNSLWGNIFHKKNEKDGEIIGVLKKVPIFEALNNRELVAIERILHHREYQENEIIFHRGDPGVGMYIIESGTVTIVDERSDQLFAELNDCDFFGELALLDESPRSATAIAKTPSKILGFFQPDLLSLIESNPRLGVKIVSRLARIIGIRLRKTVEQVISLKKELEDPKS